MVTITWCAAIPFQEASDADRRRYPQVGRWQVITLHADQLCHTTLRELHKPTRPENPARTASNTLPSFKGSSTQRLTKRELVRGGIAAKQNQRTPSVLRGWQCVEEVGHRDVHHYAGNKPEGNART